MAMDQEEMVDFLFGALARAMKHRKAALAREEAEARGVFDDEDDEDDDEGLIALDHLRSQGRVGDAPPVQAPAPSPHNDLLAQARAELEELRQREAVARMRIEIRKQREATAEVEALADEDLTSVRAEIAAQKTRTEAAEAADSRAAESSASGVASRAAESAAKGAREAEVADTGAAAASPEVAEVVSEAAASPEVDDRLAAVEAMGELMLGSDGPGEESKALAVVARVDDDDDGDDEGENAEGEEEDDADSDDDDPVAAHPLIVGQQALRRGDARAALDLFTGVVDETRAAHKRQPKDATIAAGLCQSLRAAATARLALADFSAAIRDASEAVDIAIAFHKRTPSAEALTEVAGSLCDKVEVLLAAGDRQGATTIASNGVRALKRSLKRHTSHEALALFERLRSLRAMLTRRQAG